MGHALMIKNVDFSANRLDVVQINEIIPCTGISLSESTLSFDALGETATLVATASPLATTDTIIWSSGNNDIVTVVNGVVTQVGVGTTTITATCGTYSASCSVTAVNILTYNNWKSAYHRNGSGSFDYSWMSNGDPCYAIMYGKVETPYSCDAEETTYTADDHICPIRLGENATTITISAPDTMRISITQLNCDEPCTKSLTDPNARNITFARYYGGDANVYGISAGNRTISVIEGANSALFTFRMVDGNATITDTNIASVTITVS